LRQPFSTVDGRNGGSESAQRCRGLTFIVGRTSPGFSGRPAVGHVVRRLEALQSANRLDNAEKAVRSGIDRWKLRAISRSRVSRSRFVRDQMAPAFWRCGIHAAAQTPWLEAADRS